MYLCRFLGIKILILSYVTLGQKWVGGQDTRGPIKFQSVINLYEYYFDVGVRVSSRYIYITRSLGYSKCVAQEFTMSGL